MTKHKVLKLLKEGKISSGRGAQLLGLCLADFMDLLEGEGIPFTRYTQEDWEDDKKAVKSMMRSRGAR